MLNYLFFLQVENFCTNKMVGGFYAGIGLFLLYPTDLGRDDVVQLENQES